MRDKILGFLKKNNINNWKFAFIVAVLIGLLIKLIVPADILLKPIHFLFNLYSDFLIAQCKLIYSFSDKDIAFDFLKNEIISNGKVLSIGRFYFSLYQILAILVIVFVTNSSILNKIASFGVGFLILSVYNSVRISLHASYPETISVHNWFFNLILIPSWLIVLGFAWYYWNKFPKPFQVLKQKFGFSEGYIKSTFVKIAVIVVLYYLLVILVFNDIIFLNGSLLISAILKSSKFFIDLMGYECWINSRVIYGNNSSLFMDDSCMGINLMFLFASFIALLPGALKHKLWYIPLGLIVILMLNCLRVILIFINMSKTGAYTLALEIHDLFTYPVLVFTFFMWVIWINRFYKPNSLAKNNISQG
jgi:exosortase/archaeosortase family protein